MDFFDIKEEYFPRKKVIEIYPSFKVCKTKDLMIRGKAFYAMWNPEENLWTTDEYDVAKKVDEALYSYAEEKRNRMDKNIDVTYRVKSLSEYSNNSWNSFKNYCKSLSDNAKALDTKISFANSELKKTDYVSHKLPYNLEEGDYSAWDEIIGTLYLPEERDKIEWAIGAIISGDAKSIQKFLVFYGDPGTGKSTILDIIQKLFEGYYTIFDAKSLTTNSNAFATESFKTNPLVAIQHDGDLSRIEDNSKLNSIVSHEEIVINEKFKSAYYMKMNCFLLMATNKPVKITDAKAGLVRRLIDVKPSGNKLDIKQYNKLKEQVNFQLGAIAYHCLEVYKDLGKNYYNSYRPIDMITKTDPFFNFLDDNYFIFAKEDGMTLKNAYNMYKQYCSDSNLEHQMPMYRFKDELKNYFKEFYEDYHIGNMHYRNYYKEFLTDKFERTEKEKIKESSNVELLELYSETSLLDDELKDCPAQYGNTEGVPRKKWDEVTTKLSDLKTNKVHYIRVPENHIVIDFDIKDDSGKKSKELNLAAAAKWPKTYAEFSQGGSGVHLHYIYDGDVTQLSSVYDENIEIKVYTGKSSLRRKLSKCNDIPIAHINSGLPLKEKKGDNVVEGKVIKNEKSLRRMIIRNLNKEIHPYTKPSIEFIFKILEDAYNAGFSYDVTDMRPAILTFAAKSNNQSSTCIKIVNKMKFQSEEASEPIEDEELPIIFYDVEVFPNLFLVNWKKQGKENPVIRMINPSPSDIEELCNHGRLVGFNCRRYDNHIMYARILGYTNEQLYKLSSRIVNSDKAEKNCFFREAYNLSYTDIYDFTSKKQSLKKYEIELGIHHQELGLDWNKPVPEELWDKVAEYCDNDVIATEAVWEARHADFLARQILVSICKHAGINACVNDTTNSLTTKIIFGNERKPKLVYTNLATGKQSDPDYQRDDIIQAFPGYEFKQLEDNNFHNIYRETDLGKGGYVYAEPGMYGNVALLDVASMHPHSIIAMNCFGEYTKRFEEIVQARILIKHKEFDKAKGFLDGALAPYLENEELADSLSTALKIPINSVYGLTSASYDNPFYDERNKNNIVALRGALFMRTLQDEVKKRGFTVAHIKTDSIKIPDATPEIISFVMEFGKKYGYTFEHEATYEKMCLVNDAVYIAKYKDGKHAGEWTATGTQFQVPYVFKTLFSKEKIEFADMCETKSVSKGELYLDMNEELEDEHDYQFIGKVGSFCPILPGCGGGVLYRYDKDKYNAATGTKGYRWLESEKVKILGKEDCIDKSYYISLVDEAKETINGFGDFEWFVSDEPYESPPFSGRLEIKVA